jgi:hypothetical protein
MVTATAGQVLVPTLQREARLVVVIESPEPPSVRIVAETAASPEPLLVDVGRSVTFVARLRRILEPRDGMALLTGNEAVKTEQWKSRQLVVEGDLTGPASRAVTIVAGRSLLTAVHIVGFMARKTALRKSLLSELPDVAGAAGDAGVRAFQRKLRVARVIEAGPLPPELAVAGSTIGAIAAPVVVVGCMARDAPRVQLRVSVLSSPPVLTGRAGRCGRCGGMAARAIDSAMAAA